MNIIAGGRGSGRTIELIKLVEANQGVLVVGSEGLKKSVLNVAEKLGRVIEVVTYKDLKNTYRLRGLYPQDKKFYIDNVEAYIQLGTDYRIEGFSEHYTPEQFNVIGISENVLLDTQRSNNLLTQEIYKKNTEIEFLKNELLNVKERSNETEMKLSALSTEYNGAKASTTALYEEVLVLKDTIENIKYSFWNWIKARFNN
ncbi:hypothetical protein [Enterococcus mundtii]|uniref:hypothetical protein n=1 Tax=Enterococcus mundtii TaxID=53346 RepID=UPI001A9678EC|nr:hypothetical protein [Enterococcus mundtii]MBO1087157.1 hypothetical protein [Enterococcus mundtii]